MSSFVIDKKSYVRFGALVAGVVKATRGTKREIAIYDHEKGKIMRGLDFVDKFVECYKLNVESVCKQYGDNPEVYEDNDDYMDEYARYFRYGEKIVDDTVSMLDTIWDMIHFSRSVNYQIEDSVCNTVVMEWFDAVIVKLVEVADYHADDRWMWGEFDLHLEKYDFLKVGSVE